MGKKKKKVIKEIIPANMTKEDVKRLSVLRREIISTGLNSRCVSPVNKAGKGKYKFNPSRPYRKSIK